MTFALQHIGFIHKNKYKNSKQNTRNLNKEVYLKANVFWLGLI